MQKTEDIIKNLRSGIADKVFETLYGNKPGEMEKQKARYRRALEAFNEIFPGRENVELFSAPGRTEVGGNHTDHNAGRVLAAAVNLDAIGIVSKNDTGIIMVQSEGHPKDIVDTRELEAVEGERYSSAALIRGICARMKELGYEIGGFDAYTASNVPKGSGLSSSAAFEVLIVTILNHLYNNGAVNEILSAQIAQYAENNYFGKPCGLMDQTACAVGGFVTIDFKDTGNPLVKKIGFDFASSGFSLVIVDTGGNHADLNDDYAAVQHEMKETARALGGKVLREFSEEKVLDNIAFLRTKVNDRAILRALHFYRDDRRVVEQAAALERNDFDGFLKLVVESGCSSWMLCQNCYSSKNIEEQGISLALAAAESILKGRGAWRVHGGGFAGTIQAFVPNGLLEAFIERMSSIFGRKSCCELLIRPVGTTKVEF